MKKFIYYLFFFLIPSIVVIVIYLIWDPFKVIFKYDDYTTELIPINREMMSVEIFDKNNPLYDYNSFIMGNSRSIFFPADDWIESIGTDEKISPFHFDASGDDILGTYQKLKYIDKNGNDIKYWMWIIDHQSFNTNPQRDGHLVVRSPKLNRNENLISYHSEFFASFINPLMIVSYIDYKINGVERKYMQSRLEFRSPKLFSKYNELSYPMYDKMLEKAPYEYYTEERMKVFYERDSVEIISSPKIKDSQVGILKGIKKILEKNNTHYKIVISPLYDQVKFNPNDLEILNLMFGEENVFDYSGKNNITSDYLNYYEQSHYRPHVARQIMNEIW